MFRPIVISLDVAVRSNEFGYVNYEVGEIK